MIEESKVLDAFPSAVELLKNINDEKPMDGYVLTGKGYAMTRLEDHVRISWKRLDLILTRAQEITREQLEREFNEKLLLVLGMIEKRE